MSRRPIPILKFNKNNKIVATYKSITEAAQKNDLPKQELSEVASEGGYLNGYRYFKGIKTKQPNPPSPELIVSLIDRQNEIKEIIAKMDDLSNHFT